MKKKAPKIITFFFVALFLFSLVFSFALAQDRKLEVNYPEIFGIKPETVKTFLPEYVKYIFNFSIAIFGLVVFGVLIKGGALYMTSVGNPAKIQDAKEQIFSAFLGIVILLLSYLILTTINPQLVFFKLPLLAPVAKEDRKPLEFEETEMTLISIEIPLGQMIEKGVWDEKRTEKLKTLLDDFEKFLKEEIIVNPKFDRISDLNKYLTTLTNDCRCDALRPLCAAPENWAGEVGCTGDPCTDKRDEIDKILGTKDKKGINEEKMEKLKNYKDKISQQVRALDREAEKFLNTDEKMQECLARGDLLNLNEYLAQMDFFEKQGWKTITIPNKYFSSKGDPLTFYCSYGGTMFDMPYSTPGEIPEEPTQEGTAAEEDELEQLSCPVEIPMGEILDTIGTLAYSASSDLQELMVDIDVMVEKIRDMDNLVSQCNDQNCDIACGGLPNPCYMKVCGCIPVCPGDPPFPNPCYPNPFGGAPTCLIPDLQATGICMGKNMDAPFHGYPCPRDDIEKTARKIKLYEDEFFSAIKRIKESFSDASYALNDAENPIRLDVIRQAARLCFSENTEEPDWMMLGCSMMLGNIGPDGNVVTDCHPQSFFCCTSSREALAKAPSFPSALETSRPSTSSADSGVIFPPSKYGKNNVPYFSQNRPAIWAGDKLGNCYTSIAGAGCRLTSIAMTLKYYDVNTDPRELNKWMRNNNFISSGCSMGYVYGATNKAFGVKLAETFRSNDAIVKALKAGKYPIVVGFVGGVAVTGSRGQHWIVLTGIDDDYVYKNDPIYGRGIRGIPIEVFLRTKGLKRGEFLIK